MRFSIWNPSNIKISERWFHICELLNVSSVSQNGHNPTNSIWDTLPHELVSTKSFPVFVFSMTRKRTISFFLKTTELLLFIISFPLDFIIRFAYTFTHFQNSNLNLAYLPNSPQFLYIWPFKTSCAHVIEQQVEFIDELAEENSHKLLCVWFQPTSPN